MASKKKNGLVFSDMRDWIQKLEEENELIRIKEQINLEPDVGVAARATCDMEGPGIIFENIAGYKKKAAIGLHASFRRAALALGLSKDATKEEQLAVWEEAWKKYPLKSKLVDGGPCQENIIKEGDVNLFDIPIPKLHLQDGSFYITKTLCITKDPNTGWVNVGMYRMQVMDKKRTTVSLLPFQHIAYHFKKYLEMGKPMEMAVAVGTEPLLPMISGTKIPAGWNEFDFAGGMRGVPEELTMGVTVDLPVPATTEYVFEGEVQLEERALEAPFGEFTGAYSGLFNFPVFHVRAITHRNNAIFDNCYQGRPHAESHYMSLISKLSAASVELKKLIPDITRVAFLGPYLHNMVIQGKWHHSSEPLRAMHAWWGSSWASLTKHVTCVDEDVDPWNAFEVMWAIATRVKADEDVVIVKNLETNLDPSQTEDGMTCKIGFNATKPTHPHYRYTPIEWVTHDLEELKIWKNRIKNYWKGGR